MKTYRIVSREFFRRGGQLWTSVFAVAIGIAMMTAALSMTLHSERMVRQIIDERKTAVIILPENATLRDYDNADLHESSMPESYLALLSDSGALGMHNISARLSVTAKVGDRNVTLTGVLPKGRYMRSTAPEASPNLFATPQWSGVKIDTNRTALPNIRIIDDLAFDEVAAGAQAARVFGLVEGGQIELLGRRFTIRAVLTESASGEDFRLFANLHTVQALSGNESLLHAIEITGWDPSEEEQLVSAVNRLLPEARTVTIDQFMAAKTANNTFMRRILFAMVIMTALGGGACIANFIFANIDERRREIGIYMALGADAGWIAKLFLIKAAIVGLLGGAIGYAAGTALSIAFGKIVADVTAGPLVALIPLSLALGTAISVAASLFPALRAAAIDPSTAMKEE